MEQLPKIVQHRLPRTAKPGVHPDADLLTAFAEKSLNDRERSRVLQHLAECPDCRDVVSLALPEAAAPPALSPSAGGSSWLSWPVLRWGALAACVVVVSTAVTLHYGHWQSTPPSLAEPPASKADSAFKDSQVLQPPEEELAAKLPPPSPTQSRRDLGFANNLAKQREKSAMAATVPTQTGAASPRLDRDEKDNELIVGRLADKGGIRSADEPVSPALVAAAPAPLPAARAVPTAPEAGARNDAVEYAPKSKAEITAETVKVEGAAAAKLEAPQTAEVKSKASNESQKKIQATRNTVAGAVAAGGRTADTLSANVAQATVSDDAGRVRPRQAAARWTLSPDGDLQRSFDSGKSWQTIRVANHIVFRALAANDSDIWVGGAAGALYHSSDAGEHWVQINPEADGKPLTGDIVTVEFSDIQHGQLTTANGETWTTNNAGGTWQKR